MNSYRFVAFALLACSISLPAQTAKSEQAVPAEASQNLQQRVTQLEAEVRELQTLVRNLQGNNQTLSAGSAVASPIAGVSSASTATDPTVRSSPKQALLAADDLKNLDFLRGTTINLALDTYYEYNFNHPVGRVNLLRAYDVLSNEFSLNQADVVIDHPPNVAAGRRWGGRLDLQFGQATDASQGNPSNEPRPDIYRNIFQVYGTYVVPLGKGLNIDFGKWSSSLGAEGNYTKDQINYSRSLWFNFLPFYHMGLRAAYPLSDRFTVNYWVVNGTNQVEATNGFKDEMFGFVAKPKKSLTWTVNYHFGQEHPDRAPATDCGPIPVAARPVLYRHPSRPRWPTPHLRQLRNLAGQSQADAANRGRLRHSTSLERSGARRVRHAVPRRWRSRLYPIPVHAQSNPRNSRRIYVRPRRTVQRDYSGAEREHRHI